MRLYTHFRSSAAFRVRIALNLKGIAYEPVPVSFAKGEHRAPDFQAVNPQGLVPVLDDDGTLVTQSLVIVDYLDGRVPEPRLIPAARNQRARVLSFAHVIACDTHPLNNLRVLEYLRGELGVAEPAVRRWYGHWVGAAFAALETYVRQWSGGTYCCGDRVSLADVCLVPQVYNARRFGCDLTPYPELVRIADALADTEPFRRAAPEQQPDAV